MIKTATAARSGHLGQAAGVGVKEAASRVLTNVFPGQAAGSVLVPAT